MSYFWYQRTGGEEAWVCALSEHRYKIISELRPAFVTVLDASTAPEDGWGREQFDEVRYSGPFYVDWDAESLEEAISGLRAFIDKLNELEVDLQPLRFYATGGRGFHLEIPEAVFMPKVPTNGTKFLPSVYRELAMDLLVEHMDMRVYTGRRGRMWRTCGVKRSNNLYKVPLTVDEVMGITPETYAELCSEPRPEPERPAPTLNSQLASKYMQCVERVARGVKNRGKAKKDRDLLAHFKGEWPDSVKRVMAGEGIAKGVGWNRIAMQLAIVANALGKTEQDLLKACEGLIKSHDSDGRNNSPGKRRRHLREMWHYTNESDAYQYSRGGLRSILNPDFPTGDLDGASRNVSVGHIPDGYEDEAEDPDGEQTEEQREIHNAANSLLEGMHMNRSGIYRSTDNGFRMLSNLAFTGPSVMVDVEDGAALGLEAEIFSDGRSMGRQLLSSRVFQSRNSLSGYCSGRQGVFTGSDIQANVLQLMLQRAAQKGKRVIYIVSREGLDLVQNPEDRSKVDLDLVWVGAESVLTHRKEFTYKYQPKIAGHERYKTDIHLCKPLQDSPDTRRWVQALLSMNSPSTVGQMLGWFVSCMHKQMYQRAFQQFPLLHPNGPAGSGKTLTTELLGRMYHNASRPFVYAAGSGTDWHLKTAWAESASVPLILDEYKPSEMGQKRVDFLLQAFRAAYNQGVAATGGVNRGGADHSFRDVTEYSFSAPTVYLGESQEMQTAVVQRSIPVALHPEDSRRCSQEFYIAQAGANFMPQLGRVLLAMTMGHHDGDRWVRPQETMESRAAALRPIITDLRNTLDRSVHDRQVYNLAVVVEGLNFLREALEQVFGSEFSGQVDHLKQALYDQKADLQVHVMSEAAKVLNDMSLISRTEDPDSEFALREGYEYVASADGSIDVLLRESYVKYFSWAKRKGFNPLFTTVEAFITAMGKFPPVTDKLCLASPLRKSAQARIYRFNLEKLAAEGVEGFKLKHLS